MRLLLDMSSIMWTALLKGKDPEAKIIWHEDKKIEVNTAAYGYENAVGFLVYALKTFDLAPMNMVMVFEGFNSKGPRLAIDPGYKNRDKRSPAAYAEFEELAERLKTLFRGYGAIAVSQDYAEADDVIAYLAEHTKEDVIILSNDGDLCRLVGKNAHGAGINLYQGGELNPKPFGDIPYEFVTVYKAMVGDPSDKVSGIRGFGDAAWKAFLSRFGLGGLKEMQRLGELGSLDDLAADAQQDKQVAQIYNGAADYLRSYRLVKLYPEWVNTLNYQLNWKPGLSVRPLDDERLAPWNPNRKLITADNWSKFVDWAMPIIKQQGEAALDIETSTPEESDAWLESQGRPDGVDVIGSNLTGMSLTFGPNNRFTVYISVDHVDTPNVNKQAVGVFLADLQKAGVRFVIHNTMFEGPVLRKEYLDLWKPLGNNGLLMNWLDTKMEASYVDENGDLGLKKLARRWFNYDQVDYATTTTVEIPVVDVESQSEDDEPVEEPDYSILSIGRFKGVFKKEIKPAVFGQSLETGEDIVLEPAQYQSFARFQLKMNELTAKHVFDYACDDTVVTAYFHNFAKLIMELEGTYTVYQAVEIPSSYTHALSFCHGTKISIAKLNELKAMDDEVFDEAWVTVKKYLIEKRWEGTAAPTIPTPLTAAFIKEVAALAGQTLKTMVRTPAKVIELVESAELRKALTLAMQGEPSTLAAWIDSVFVPDPVFNPGSPVQMSKLFYETLGLTCKVFNKVTEAAKARGETEGTAKTDALAIQYGLQELTAGWEGEGEDPRIKVLRAIQLMKMVQTRRGLFYEPYPYFVHWQTGRVHSSHNQCATNTRRASSSTPNTQQLPKHAKLDGYMARFREIFVPHKRKAVIVSMDFAAQELRIIADYSQDANMLACFVGDSPKDMHALTGLGIVQNNEPVVEWSYELFMQLYNDVTSPMHKTVKSARTLGKKVNFTTEYGAMAPKLAATLLVSEEEAQSYIDAKEAAFPRASEWKTEVIAEAWEKGYVTTKMGARRHLADALKSDNRSTSSKAERQAVNFKVQGSAAEMTKLAEGRMWEARLEENFDCEIIGPIHDEVVASCSIEDLPRFLPVMHKCMIGSYADMTVPIESSISFGPSFGVQIEIGNSPSLEAITKGLSQLEISA